jgi:hypothetical protein
VAQSPVPVGHTRTTECCRDRLGRCIARRLLASAVAVTAPAIRVAARLLAQSESPAASLKRLETVRTSVPITIDGGSEPAWATAATIAGDIHQILPVEYWCQRNERVFW